MELHTDRQQGERRVKNKNTVLNRLEHVIMELQLEFDGKSTLKKSN